jgi:hypothetical protein
MSASPRASPVEPETRGVALALQSVTDDLGRGLGPIIVATFISRLGGRREAFNIAFVGWFPSALLILGLIFCMRKDEAAVQARLAARIKAAALRDLEARRRSSGSSGGGGCGCAGSKVSVSVVLRQGDAAADGAGQSGANQESGLPGLSGLALLGAAAVHEVAEPLAPAPGQPKLRWPLLSGLRRRMGGSMSNLQELYNTSRDSDCSSSGSGSGSSSNGSGSGSSSSCSPHVGRSGGGQSSSCGGALAAPLPLVRGGQAAAATAAARVKFPEAKPPTPEEVAVLLAPQIATADI